MRGSWRRGRRSGTDRVDSVLQNLLSLDDGFGDIALLAFSLPFFILLPLRLKLMAFVPRMPGEPRRGEVLPAIGVYLVRNWSRPLDGTPARGMLCPPPW